MSKNKLKREIDPFTMVTNSILNDATVSLSAKGLYAFMRSKPDGWNFTIRSMAKQLKEGQSAIGNYLKELRDLGWVSYEKHKDGTGTYYIMASQPIENKPEPENSNQGLCNMQKPTRISNTDLYTNTDSSNNTMSGKPDNTDAIQVIDYLNSKAGRQFRPTATNIRLVNARLKEGITLEQLYEVVDQKCKDWIGSKFEQYLRPATLFGAEKCNQYVGQIGMQIKDSKPQSQNEKRSNWANEWENVFGNGGNQMPDDYDGLTIEMEQKQ